ncbi:hypothetical protein IF2G_10424 [Cordyceps javanica]|nr:hypothetical protein IF2G_10424 [Cordyceps javanica]
MPARRIGCLMPSTLVSSAVMGPVGAIVSVFVLAMCYFESTVSEGWVRSPLPKRVPEGRGASGCVFLRQRVG